MPQVSFAHVLSMGRPLWQSLSYPTPFIHYYLLILLVIIATSHCICIKVDTVQLPGMLLIEKYLPMRCFLLISVYTAE